MHIAIEGLDGAGKTQTAKVLAERLGFLFIEKPLHYLTDALSSEFENYMRITSLVNKMSDKKFRARFYGLGNLYTSYLSRVNNIITDRHLASNYYWNNDSDDEYFKSLVSDCGHPDITYVLYVSSDERKRRIRSRDSEDPDLKRSVFSDEPYERIVDFLECNNMRYEVINATKISLDEVVNIILKNILMQKN